MNRDFDPTGAMPQADETGRVVLTTSSATIAQSVLGAVLLSGLTLFTVLYGYQRFINGGLPPGWDQPRLLGLAAAGIIAIPLTPLSYLACLFPPRLEINNDGVVFQNLARTRRMSWADIVAVRLRAYPVDRFGDVKKLTVLVGPKFKLSWMPVFGVAPGALASYLVARKQAASGVSLTIDETMPFATRINQSLAHFNTNVMLPMLLGVLVIMLLIAVSVLLWAGWVIHE